MPDHKQAKSVSYFVVDIYLSDDIGDGGNPKTYKTNRLTLKQGITTFTVAIEPGPGNSKTSPAIVGPLQPGGSRANPALMYKHEGSHTIDSVSLVTFENRSVTHAEPAEVWIWQC
jgi:hypothetical protein